MEPVARHGAVVPRAFRSNRGRHCRVDAACEDRGDQAADLVRGAGRRRAPRHARPPEGGSV